MKLMDVPVASVLTDINRIDGGNGDIDALAANLDEFGQINPITLVETGSGGALRIVTGRRRYAAAQKLGWDSIKAIVYEKGELDAGEEELALAENTAREEMSPIDEGIAFARMLRDGKSAEEVGAVFCRTKAQVYQRAKLNNLIPELKERLRSGFLTVSFAAKLATFSAGEQERMAEEVKRFDDKLPSWAERDVLEAAEALRIGDKFTCEQCASCSRRSHFSDGSLFEELSKSDYCFDSACYNRLWKQDFDERLSRFLLDAGNSVERVIVAYDEDSIPGVTGGVVVCNGEQYTIENLKTCRLLSDARSLPPEIVHTGIVCKPFGELFEVADFAYAKDFAAVEKSRADEEKKAKESAVDAFYSALPEPVREEVKKKAGEKPRIDSSVLWERAHKLCLRLRDDPVAYKVMLCSQLAYDFYSMSRDYLVFFKNITGLAADVDVYSTDNNYSALMQLDVEELESLQEYIFLSRVYRSWVISSEQSLDGNYIVKRLIAAGVDIDVKGFVDGCVKAQYADELAAHAAGVAESVEAPDLPTDGDEPDASSEDGAESKNDDAESEDDEAPHVTDLNACGNAGDLMRRHAGKN